MRNASQYSLDVCHLAGRTTAANQRLKELRDLRVKTLMDRWSIQSPAKFFFFLEGPALFQTVSKEDFPDGSV